MKKVWVIIWLLPFLASAQYESKIDSLNTAFDKATHIEEKAEIKVALLEIYLSLDRQKAKIEIDDLLTLGKKNDCLKCLALGQYYNGHYYSYESATKQAIVQYEKAAATALQAKDIYLHRKSRAWIAQEYLSNKQFEEAEQILTKLIDEVEKDDDKTGIEDNYFLLAILNYERGFLNRAIENYIQVENNIRPDNPYANVYKIKAYNNIAQSYRELKKYKKGLEYIEKGITMARKQKDTFNLMNLMINRGITQITSGDITKGIQDLEKTYAYFTAIEEKAYQTSSALFLGIAFQKMNRLEESNAYLDIAEINYQQVGDSLSWAQALSTKAGNNLRIGNNTTALHQVQAAYQLISYREFSPVQIEVLESYINILIENGKYEKAVPLLVQKDSLEEILTERMDAERFYELEAKYQAEKKEQEIALLSTQNNLSEQRRKNQQYLYIGVLALLLVLAGLLFLGYRNKIKLAAKTKELDALKSRFFANVSHEFRTPLSLIKSPVQQLRSTIDTHAKKQLDLIDQNADRMLELVDQLLELSKLEAGQLKIILKKASVASFLNTLLEPFVYRAEEEAIPFEVTINPSGTLHYFDRDILTKIVVNLLSNAFKYRESGPVTFHANIENQTLKLEISNLNHQVKENDLQRFFERFYQTYPTSVGFGIGLAMVKDLVTLYEGTIQAKLDRGRVCILVTIPVHPQLKNALVIDETTLSDTPLVSPEIEHPLEGTPILLIADDHPDIRMLLRELFKHDFTILEAKDGEQAFEMAKKEIPDIIITDVMMPKKDGFTLLNQLKQEELTASIPVVLLTAKAGEESHLKSLQSWADGYFTKPFHHEILKAKIHQLLQERKQLQERYGKELILRPVDVALSTADEKFIKRLESILAQELTNPNFTTDNFAEQMNLSRMQLHRKLKSLFGVSASEFVRNERVKTAAELLKNPTVTVAEVAYSSGFNEVTYFSKCFKNRIGLSPSAFRKNL